MHNIAPVLDYPFGQYHLDAYVRDRTQLMRDVWHDAFTYYDGGSPTDVAIQCANEHERHAARQWNHWHAE